MYATNVRGPYLLARSAAGAMRAQQKGRIVNVASVAVSMPAGSSIAYATSKSSAHPLDPLPRGGPGAVRAGELRRAGLIEGTRMAQRLPAAMVERHVRWPFWNESATPDDIADQVLAFCRSDSVTGQVLPIDAGIFPH